MCLFKNYTINIFYNFANCKNILLEYLYKSLSVGILGKSDSHRIFRIHLLNVQLLVHPESTWGVKNSKIKSVLTFKIFD